MFEFYKQTLARRVNDLLMGVIALGVLVAAIEYIQIGTSLENAGDVHDLLQRVVLLFLVIFFACYILLAYAAYWDAIPAIEQELEVIRFNDLSSNRIIFLFLLDIIQVALVACMVGTLLVGDLTSFKSPPQSAGIAVDLKLINYAFLFALAFAWHFVIVIWYSIRGGALRTRGLHLGYSGVYVLFFVAILFMDRGEAESWHWIAEWVLTLIFAGLICSLFWIKGKTDLDYAAQQLNSVSV